MMMTDSKVGTLETEAAPASATANLLQDEGDESSGKWLHSDEDSEDDMFSSDDDEAPSSSLEELQKEFKARDELLTQLLVGVDPTYARLMRENERAVRAQKLQRLHQKNDPNQNRDSNISSANKQSLTSVDMNPSNPGIDTNGIHTDDEHKIGVMERLYRLIVFDVQNMISGFLVLFLNCIAYNGLGQIVRSFVVLLSAGGEFEHLALLPSLIVVLTLIIMRFTGGMCDWVGKATYARVKFDMKNRLRLGKWDARALKWFRQHEIVKTHVNVLCFFAFIYAVYTFQEHALAWAFDSRRQLFEDLPSVKQGLMSSVGRRLSTGLEADYVQRTLGDVTCVSGMCSLKEDDDDLARQDKDFLASNIAHDCFAELMGNEAAILCSESVLFWYYAITSVIAIFLLKKMGHQFWSI